MINIIKKDGLDGGLKYIRNIRDLLLTSNKQKLFLILTNMQNIISEQRKKRRVFFVLLLFIIRNLLNHLHVICLRNYTFACDCIYLISFLGLEIVI